MSVGGLGDKENRAPLHTQSKKSAAAGPSGPPPAGGAPSTEKLERPKDFVSQQSVGNVSVCYSELSRTSRLPRHADLEAAAHLDLVREELRKKNLQLQAKDRKLEDYQRRTEVLMEDKKAAYQKLAEVETERDRQRRLAHDREQELLSQQRKADNYKTAVEGRVLRSCEEREKKAAAEIKRLRQLNEELEESARKFSSEEQQRAASELRKSHEEDVNALRQSILALEARCTRAEGEAEEARQDAINSKARVESALKARDRAEDALKSKSRDLAEEAARRTAEEEDLRRRSELRAKDLEAELNSLKSRCAELEQDYATERARVQGLEQQLAARCSEMADFQAQHQQPQQFHSSSAFYDLELEKERQARLALETQAEAASDELRKWKEWADEQQLRELLADTQHLEELNRVREELKKQVEMARQEVDGENFDIRAKYSEVAQELEILNHELELERDRWNRCLAEADEERRQLESELARARASKVVAEEELTEVREALNSQCGVDPDQQALVQQLRWRLIARETSEAHRVDGTSSVVKEVLRRGSQWRQAALEKAGSSALVQQQTSELERLDAEAETLRRENNDLSASVQRTREELQSAFAEVDRLREREEQFEVDMLRASDRGAELAGHNNHKQKIQYLTNLKAENQQLREELRQSKRQTASLEGKLRASHFYSGGGNNSYYNNGSGSGSVSSNNYHSNAGLAERSLHGEGSGPTASPSKIVHEGRCSTPNKSRRSFAPWTSSPGRDVQSQSQNQSQNQSQSQLTSKMSEQDLAALRRERAEVARQVSYHRRASEKATMEYQQLASLVEQLVGTKTTPAAVKGASSITEATEKLGKVADPALHRRLEELVNKTKAKHEVGETQEPEFEASPPNTPPAEAASDAAAKPAATRSVAASKTAAAA